MSAIKSIGRNTVAEHSEYKTPMPSESNLYELLEVDPTADVYTIRLSWRRLVSIYHPDVPETGDAQMFETITKAWLTLCDDQSRAAYDRSLQKFDT